MPLERLNGVSVERSERTSRTRDVGMQNELELCEKGKAKILAIALSHGGRYQTINCSSSGEGVRAPVLQNDQEPPALHTE